MSGMIFVIQSVSNPDCGLQTGGNTQTEDKMKTSDFFTESWFHCHYQKLIINSQANLTYSQANQSAIQINQSTDFHSD